jgi:hypothetical protein
MLADWVFMVALLLASCLFLFHGIVLLLAPSKYLPLAEWGPYARLELRRKPPLYLSRRLTGLGLSALIVWWPMRHAILWMLRPTPGNISFGAPLAPTGIAEWHLLGLGLFALAAGLYLIWKPQGSARMMLRGQIDTSEEGKRFRLWTLYVRIGGLCFAVFSLLLFNQFVRSLR